MITNPLNRHFLHRINPLRLRDVKVFITSIALAATCVANPSEPGESALNFLEKVQAGTVDLAPDTDTAISPQTSTGKSKEIQGRLKRTAYDIGQTSLTVGKIKKEGNLAAVMVWKAEGFDPSDMQVFPVAMIKRNDKWLPAPILASFDNAGVGYDKKTRKDIEALEKWMLEQRVFDLQQLRSEAVGRMRKSINEEFKGTELKKMNGMQAATEFLNACSEQNIYKVMGFVGGLAETLPKNWPLRANSVQEAMAANPTPIPWSLLSSPYTLRVVVNHEEGPKTALISLACLDPSYIESPKSPPSIQIIHLNLEKSNSGIWQINLPETFYGQPSSYKNAGDPALDRDLYNAFPQKVRALYPATPMESPEKARAAILNALQSGSLKDLTQLIHIPNSSNAARDALVEASQLWWSIRGSHTNGNPSSISMLVPLETKTLDDQAAISCQWFSARKPDRFLLKFLNLSLHEKGWLWTPQLKPDKDLDAWQQLQEQKWRDNWQAKVLVDCPVIEKLDEKNAVSEEDAKKLVQSWLETCESGNVQSALKHCALLNLKDSPSTLLRNLGYDMVGAIKRENRAKLGDAIQQGSWNGVGVSSSLSEQPAYPLYPVVNTPDGPKILLEVDLLATGGRGRGFLNRTSIERLSKFNNQAAKTLQELFETFEKQVLAEPK